MMQMLSKVDQQQVQGGAITAILAGALTALTGAALIVMKIYKNRQPYANVPVNQASDAS